MEARYDVETLDGLLETHRLVDRETGARVTLAPSRGGLVTRFSVGDDELLYLDEETLRDPSRNVRGGIPVLFPFAGRLANDLLADGDRSFAAKQHGFARTRAWAVRSTLGGNDDAAWIELALESDAATLEAFPFPFVLEHRWMLRDGALSLRATVRNTGERPMRVAPGLHPYFHVPDARKGETRVVTDATRALDNRTGETVAIDGPIDLTAQEVDLHLLDHGPRAVRLVRPPGTPNVLADFSADHRVLVVWTIAGRDYVCVEPWTAPGNALNTGGGIAIEPGASHESSVRLRAGAR